MKRRLISSLLFLCLSAGLAWAETDPLAGAWEVEGTHRTRGRYVGEIEFSALDTGGYAVRKSVRFAGEGSETLTGFARLDGSCSSMVLVRTDHVGIARRIGLGQSEEAEIQEIIGQHKRGSSARFDGWTWSRTDAGDSAIEHFHRDRRLNRVHLMVDAREYHPLLFRGLGAARQSIDFEMFAVHDDAVGRRVVQALVTACRRGVRVRVLVDGLASFGARSLFSQVRQAGGQVIFVNGVVKGLGNALVSGLKGIRDGIGRLAGAGRPRRGENRTIVNRDHRKVIVVDRSLAFVGGMNLGEKYTRWHDVHTASTGPVVSEVLLAFEERWLAAGGKSVPERQPIAPPFDVEGMEVPAYVRANVPGISDAIRREYLLWIGSARREVFVETPYFLESSVVKALSSAASRGVAVHVIIPDPAHDTKNLVGSAWTFIQNDAIRAGVNVYRYQGRFVHAKVATIDGAWSTVGSCNLDDMSAFINAELNICVPDADFAALVKERVFTPDLATSKKQCVRQLEFWEKAKGRFWLGLRRLI